MVFVLPSKTPGSWSKVASRANKGKFSTHTHTKTNRGLGWQNQLFPKVKQEGQSSSSGGLREKDKSFLIIFVSTSQIRSGRESVEKCSTPLSLSLHTWVRISHTTFIVARIPVWNIFSSPFFCVCNFCYPPLGMLCKRFTFFLSLCSVCCKFFLLYGVEFNLINFARYFSDNDEEM